MSKSEVKYDPLSVGSDALAIGGATAAIVAMIRQVIEARRQEKEMRKLDDAQISPDTVVLHVGKPGAMKKVSEESVRTSGETPVVTVVPGVVSKEIHPASTVGPRELNGRFSSFSGAVDGGVSEKSAGYASGILGDTAAILAGLGGSVGGYYVVSKLAQKLEQNRLKRQIAAAQTEYLDLLDGKSVKNAEAFSHLFSFGDSVFDDVTHDGMSKEAGIPTDLANLLTGGADVARKGSAVALATYILTAGGTAYVVKKYLESRFGKRDQEEKPEKQTKILFKAGADEPFELDPGLMLATVGILRDCISDSDDLSEKRAADYSFLSKLDKVDGGPQFLLDSYARMKGLSRPDSEFKIPLSMRIRYGRTLSDIRKNPEKHAPQIQGYMMQLMRRDPKKWFDLLGQDRNSDIVGLKADEQISNLRNSGGLFGMIHRTPVLGDLVRQLMSSFSKGTAAGRRGVAEKALEALGMTGDAANSILGMYDFSPTGWRQKPAMNKGASFGYRDLMALAARDKTLSDSSNKEILQAIEALRNPKGKKGKDDEVSVEFDEELSNILSEEDKMKIIKHLSK